MLLAGVGLAAVLILTGVIEGKPTPAQQSPLPVSTPALDPSTFEWTDVASWESSGDDDSPPFHISGDSWRILWVTPRDSVGDGSFAIHVYDPNGLFLVDLFDTAHAPESDFDAPIRGGLHLSDPGDYFIRVKTAREYQLTIQQLR